MRRKRVGKVEAPFFSDAFKVGDRVAFDYSYGRIVAARPHYRCGAMREETLFHVRHYDPQTGRLRECPDPRCKGEGDGCPICARTLWHNEMRPICARDMAHYVEYGLIRDTEGA